MAAASRVQLETGTWPQVMAVFTYQNRRASLTEVSEFVRLTAFYEDAGLQHLASFTRLVQFEEQAQKVPVSFNFSMRPRFPPENAPSDRTHPAAFLGFPDVLVGTRNGIEGAAVWLRNFAAAVPGLVPESAQVMDKIFGEALTLLAGSSQRVTLEEMFRTAFGLESATLPAPEHKN